MIGARFFQDMQRWALGSSGTIIRNLMPRFMKKIDLPKAYGVNTLGK